MSIHRKSKMPIDGRTVFATDATRYGYIKDLPECIPALHQMYRDAFLYGHRAWVDNYDAMDFQVRKNIQHLYDFINDISPRLNGYNWQSESVMLDKEDYMSVYEFFELGGDIDCYIECLEEMVFVSTLYKFRHEPKPKNADDIENIHFSFTVIKGFLKSYIREEVRSNLEKQAA